MPNVAIRRFLRLLAVLLACGTLPAHAAGVRECTLIVDQATGAIIQRQGVCEEQFTPASTFKVPLALIGYDAGILKDARTPAWNYRPEFKARKRDRKTVDPTIWERDSVLWYSQEITRSLGEASFADYVRRLRYGNMDVSGGLTAAWLDSSLRISPDEQVAFLRRLIAGEHPVSRQAHDLTMAILPEFDADGWKVHGKTGTGRYAIVSGGVEKNLPLGWFVGWAEKGGRKLVFARLRIDDMRSSTPAGPRLRDEFLKELPGIAGAHQL